MGKVNKEMISRLDYAYCKDCDMFIDLWKYDHDIEDAGHEGHSIFPVTEEEFKDIMASCEKAGCFDEEFLVTPKTAIEKMPVLKRLILITSLPISFLEEHET